MLIDLVVLRFLYFSDLFSISRSFSSPFSFFALVYSRLFPSDRPHSFPIQIHFRRSYRRPLPKTILYGRYLRLLLLHGDGYRCCMAAAHRETILTAKKAGGTLRCESCNLSRVFPRDNLQFGQIAPWQIARRPRFNYSRRFPCAFVYS